MDAKEVEKRIVVLLCVALHISAQMSWGEGTGVTAIDVAVPELSYKILPAGGGNVVLKMNGCPQGGTPGDPMLPYYRVLVLVPLDADLRTASVQLTAQRWRDLSGEHRIQPVPPAATWAGNRFITDWGGKDEDHIADGRDLLVYEKDAYFPSEVVEVMSVGSYRQLKLVECRVWLAQYNPPRGILRVLDGATAQVSVEGPKGSPVSGEDSAAASGLGGPNEFVRAFTSQVANPQDIERFYAEINTGMQNAAASQGDYVIITTQAIVNNSTKLNEFIPAKQARGYEVTVVTEGPALDDNHYVSGNSADARANNIRLWLQSASAPHDMEYVLLIGDPHPQDFSPATSVPMKMCWPRGTPQNPAPDGYNEAPTDMYYAELTADWNPNQNDWYGEWGEGEKFCDVNVGRIPFYGSYSDLDHILEKTVRYQFPRVGDDMSWRDKVLIGAAISNFSPQDNDGDGDAEWWTGDYTQPNDRTFGDDWGEAVKNLAGQGYQGRYQGTPYAFQAERKSLHSPGIGTHLPMPIHFSGRNAPLFLSNHQ